MKAILVQLDRRTLEMLEEVVPARSRKRSEFIRQAIVKALLDVTEVETARAYRRALKLHGPEPYAFDPAMWAPESEAIHPRGWKPPGKRKRKRTTRRRTR